VQHGKVSDLSDFLMSHRIALSPHGSLRLEAEASARPMVDAARLPALASAFEQSSGHGLVALGSVFPEEPLPVTLAYWRDMAERYLKALRDATPEDVAEDEALQTIPAPSSEWEELITQAPPGPGMEYLSASALEALWLTVEVVVHAYCEAHDGGVRGWLAEVNPDRQLLGRVSFHLAENKRDERKPFAFIATYSHGMSARERLQHVPLSRALIQYAGEGNKVLMERLLRPVQEAAQKCALVKQLVDSRHLFQPLAWTPRQAYAFMQEIPKMESSGLVVKVPNWWKGKRPSQPKVSVNVGKSFSCVGPSSMLDFSVGMALEGETLTQEEMDALLQSDGNLVRLRGQWVEVDQQRLEEVLQHWQGVANSHYNDGISFLDGMRLLAGYRGEADQSLFTDDVAHQTDLQAGDWLREALETMRDPARADDVLPGEELQATLRPYQEDGVNWLWFVYQMGIGACLADDMGLGKTIQIIALLLIIKRTAGDEKKRPSLLVVPSSLLGNWRAELEKFAPSLKVFLMHPSQTTAEERKQANKAPEAFYQNYDLVITTYGLTRRVEGLREGQWDLLVLDEAQAIKNPNTAQTRAVKQVRSKVRVALSGTPIENRLSDLWSLFDFMNPKLLGTFPEFKKFTKALETAEQPDYAPLRKLARPYILRRLKTDKSIIADLPDKIEMRILCQLTKVQAAHYSKAVDELAEAMDGEDENGIKRRGVVLAFLMRFKQICNHPAQWGGSGEYTVKGSGKFERLVALCEEMASRQERVLVFTQFREMTTPLSSLLAEQFGREGLVLHGGIAVKARQRMVDDFQREDGPPFFVLSLKAGGTGLNLTKASQVIHFDRWWNPAVEDQATDRAFRIGQQNNVLVHKFVCQGTIEEKIDLLISEKRALAEDILGPSAGAEKLLTNMSTEELLDFVAIDLNKAVAS
jgi:hypothetical protein